MKFIYLKVTAGDGPAEDGGINADTGARCAAAGANVLLAGSSLYHADDMRDAIAAMRWQAESARKS